jgi:hypothetical protein
MFSRRKKVTAGAIPKIHPMKVVSLGTAASAVDTLFSAVNSLIDAANGRLSLGDGSSFSWAGNIDATEVEWTTPSSPDTEFTVPHLLGRQPARVEVTRKDRAVDIYDSGTVWTREFIHLKANVASALVLLRIS